MAVVGPRTTVDLAVPASVPLAHLLPNLLRLAVPDRVDDGGTTHGGWVLATPDGGVLDAGRSLAAQQIREGSLLVLRPAREHSTPPLYDDVVEVITTRSIGTPWDPPRTRVACGVLAAVATAGIAGTIVMSTGPLGGILAIVMAVLLLGGATVLARAVDDVAAATLAAVLAAPLGAIGAARLLDDHWTAAQLLVAAAVVLVVTATGAALVRGGAATFASLAVVGGHGVIAGLVPLVTDASATRTAALVAPLALTLTTTLPTLALRLVRIPRPQLPKTADDIAMAAGQVKWERTSQQVDRARQLLSGLTGGTHVVLALGIAVLATGNRWSVILAAILTVLVAVRTRLHRERAQVLAPVVTVAVALLAIVGAVSTRLATDNSRLLGIMLPSLCVFAVGVGLVGVLRGRRAASPRTARLMDIAELALLLAMAPMVLAVWDVYSALLELAT